jgi:uncharacterized protein involved in outer membrane biogenesis
MKILIRVFAAIVVLIVLGVVAAVVYLPDLLKSEAVRERIRVAAQESLGREIQYSDLDFRFLPPSLVVEKVSIAGESAGAKPLLTAESVALRVALAPLFARTVLVDSLVVKNATVHLVRTANGIALPGTQSTASGKDAGAAANSANESEDGSGSAVAIASSKIAIARFRSSRPRRAERRATACTTATTCAAS